MKALILLTLILSTSVSANITYALPDFCLEGDTPLTTQQNDECQEIADEAEQELALFQANRALALPSYCWKDELSKDEEAQCESLLNEE